VENKLNATTQKFLTAKISGCALKQYSKTHSSLRQRKLQWQNGAALLSCRIGAVEHRKRPVGVLTLRTLGFARWILAKLHKN